MSYRRRESGHLIPSTWAAQFAGSFAGIAVLSRTLCARSAPLSSTEPDPRISAVLCGLIPAGRGLDRCRYGATSNG